MMYFNPSNIKRSNFLESKGVCAMQTEISRDAAPRGENSGPSKGVGSISLTYSFVIRLNSFI